VVSVLRAESPGVSEDSLFARSLVSLPVAFLVGVVLLLPFLRSMRSRG
jgi:hypothetical protein